MNEIKLDVQIRNQIGTRNTNKVRRNDFIPAIVYGETKKKGATPIQVERRAFEKIMRAHRGENVIFHLNILEGEKKLRDYAAIIKEEQHDPVTEQILHVDFKHISLTEKITVKVTVVAKGDPVGVKQDGGSLEHALWDIDVICLPTQIPHHIEVNVSHLKLNESIHVKDLILPSGVTTKHDPDAIVVIVAPPMKEEVMSAEAAAAAPTEPEVIKEKPKEKKEEGAAAEKKPAEPAKAEGK